MDVLLNDRLLQTLKCPCCFQYMMTPIYICLSGHSICRSCWNANSCPICKLVLTDTRNFGLENITALVCYPCENEDRGCHRFFDLEELNEHRQICDYRSYACGLSKYCCWQGTRDKLKKHYLDEHDNSVVIGNERVCLWTPDKPDSTVYLMLAFDEIFHVHVRLRDDVVYWVVQYIGPSDDVILFYFEVQIFTDQYNNRKLEFSEICHDDTKDDIDEIIDSGFCVAVPLPILETYVGAEEVVFHKIQIKRA